MMCSDLPALLDEWASSLFRELDYRREAANGTRFKVPRAAQTANPQLAACCIHEMKAITFLVALPCNITCARCTLLMADLLLVAGICKLASTHC
jgi:hypothetical protein